jgi:hypothetical protein
MFDEGLTSRRCSSSSSNSGSSSSGGGGGEHNPMQHLPGTWCQSHHQ